MQLKKSKSREPFWSYQLNITADLANLAQFRGKWAEMAVLFSWWLQNGSQDFLFSIVLGAEYFSYVKSIETHARTFLALNILSIGTV